MFKRLILYLFTLLPIFSFADEVNFTLSAPNVVSMGEQFRLVVALNQDGRPNLPKLDGFDVIYGPSTSQSTSIQIINGKRSSSREYSYTYILQAKSEGSFTVQPATVKIDNQEYKSNSLKIEVVKGNSSSQNNNSGSSNQNNFNEAEMSKDDLFARISLSKSEAYKGEQIIATIKLYASPNVPIAGFGDVSFPSFEGFFTQDIEMPQQINFEREAYNNKIYQVGTIKKVILYPQQKGEIKISPFQIECIIRKKVGTSRGGLFDGMFDNYQNISSKVISNTAQVSVQEIPSAPTKFEGAVGTLKMNAAIDKTEAKANDAITLKLTIEGNGNLRLINAPKIEFPEDFEVYDPKKSESLRATSNGQQGSITFEYLIIPRFAGKYTIPPIDFISFDPSNKSFVTNSSQAFNLTIDKGNEDYQQSLVTGNTSSFANKEDVKLLSNDIRYIMQNKYQLKKADATFYGSLNFWLIYLISTLAFVVIAVIYRKKLKENADIVLSKNKKANKVAQKRLKLAASFMKEHKSEEFYESILKAFWGYLGDKLAIPISKLTRENAVQSLQKMNVNNELIEEFVEIIKTCEFARYAPSASDAAIEELYDRSADLMGKLDKQIKR
ncbi:MAG: BatD family protein [Mangrovibacterium sp.]